jgi:hypothetical protein
MKIQDLTKAKELDSKTMSRSDRYALIMTLCFAFLTGAVNAQALIIDPGETAQIGDATDFSETVSSCGGLNVCEVEAFDNSTMGAITAVTGIGSTKSASVTLLNTITVTGDSDRAIEGRISGSVRWSGDLESVGAIGAAAFVTIDVSVVDLTTGLVVAGAGVVSKECETFLILDSCLKRVSGSAPVNFAVSLQRGRSYELRFNLTCKSSSGLGDARCVFNENGNPPLAGGSVSRSEFTLSLEPDLVGLIEELQYTVDMLKSQLEDHDAQVKAAIEQHDTDVKSGLDRNNEATLEAIRLLNTPQGQRETDQPACNGNDCKFPNKNGS